jgi:Calx-beta domain/Papain family cysteine protease
MPCFEGVDATKFRSGVGNEDPSLHMSEVGILDAAVTVDESDNQAKAFFTIYCAPLNYDQTVTCHWQTRSGTATPGNHYINASGTATFGPSVGNVTIPVNILTPNIDDQTLIFYVDISSPTNATLDAGSTTGECKVSFRGGGDDDDGDDGHDPSPEPRPQDPIKLRKFIKWKIDDAVVYDQTRGCCTMSMCTAFAATAYMSCLWWFKHHERKRFAARELFDEAHLAAGYGNRDCCSGGRCQGTSNCPSGFFDAAVRPYLKTDGVKFQSGSSDLPKNGTGSYHRIKRTPFISDSDHATLIKKLKRAIYSRGAVYMVGTWYSDWMNVSRSNGYVLPKRSGVSGKGHAIILTGWDNDHGGGCFQFQSSWGRDFGNEGRAWIKYSQINEDLVHDSGFTGGGDPWSRFYSMTLL